LQVSISNFAGVHHNFVGA
jgi:hypothetical protein